MSPTTIKYMKFTILFIAICLCFTSCLPNTGGKEESVDVAIHDINKVSNQIIDTLQGKEYKIYFGDTSVTINGK